MHIYGKNVTELTVRQINQLYRDHDESQKWPICGEFNVTERAIRRIRKIAHYNGTVTGIEYALMLDEEISRIVNSINQ